MKNCIIFFCIIALGACSPKLNNDGSSSNDSLSAKRIIRGLYYTGKFIDCDNPRIVYNMDDETQSLDTLYKKVLPYGYPKQAVMIEVRGRIPSDRAKDLIIVDSVLKMEEKNASNTCLPYDFWCKGTEPFWVAEISESENLIDFIEPVAQRVTHFEYSAPVVEKDKTIYTATNDSLVLQIRIKNEFCTDGMSERRYNFSVEVNFAGKVYRGCAYNYTEPK